jgi:hypothetical protein
MHSVEQISNIVIGEFRKRHLRACCFSGSLIISHLLNEISIKNEIIAGYASLEENSFFRHVWLFIDDPVDRKIIDCNWMLKDLEKKIGIKITYFTYTPVSGELFIGDTQEEKEATRELEEGIGLMKINREAALTSVLEDREIGKIFRSCKKALSS